MVLHFVRGPDAPAVDEGVDLDAEAGFFKMSPSSAEQVTVQIRSMMERAWEYIAIAYQGRAHIALGYESWDEYVDARLGDLRLTVPRRERGAVVQSLSRAQLSLRAIAKVLGVDVATVHRALGAGDSTGLEEGDHAGEPTTIRGRDGKSYPRRRRPGVAACSVCGELHDAGTVECPWDLFAQGRAPRPGRQDDRPAERGRHHEGARVAEVDKRQEASVGVDLDVAPEPKELHVATVVDSLTRAVCLVDELATLPQLVDEIEIVGSTARETGLADGIRELIEHLRAQAATMVELVDRLERLTPLP